MTDCRHEWVYPYSLDHLQRIHQTPDEDMIGLDVTCFKEGCGQKGIEWYKFVEVEEKK